MSSVRRLFAVALLFMSPIVMVVQVTAGLAWSLLKGDIEGGWDRLTDDIDRWHRTYTHYTGVALGRIE